MKKDWTLVPFEEVCASMMKGPFGSDIKKSLYVPKSDDAYKVYIQANAIEKDASIGDYYISKEYFDTKMYRFEVKPNDYIITCDGTLGKFLRLPQTIERGIISASLLRITLNSRIVPKFFEYLWDGYVMERLTSDIRNSALVHLPSASKIGKVEIPLPPLAEQERIVAELDLLSGIIDKQKAQLKELDTFAQSIFYDMFGNPYFNNKHWDVQQLGDVCSFSQGVQVDVSEQITEPREGWNRFLRIVDYTSDNTDIRYVNINNQQYWIDKDDIAMVRYGSVGVVGINKTGILANNLFRINYHRHQFDKHFLLYFFNTDFFHDYIAKVAFGATMPALSFKVMKSLKIFIPDISLQRLFAEKIVAIESQKETINRSIAESQKLFDYTMDKYFG